MLALTLLGNLGRYAVHVNEHIVTDVVGKDTKPIPRWKLCDILFVQYGTNKLSSIHAGAKQRLKENFPKKDFLLKLWSLKVPDDL